MPTQRRQIMGAVKSAFWDELMQRLDEEDGYVPDEEEMESVEEDKAKGNKEEIHDAQ